MMIYYCTRDIYLELSCLHHLFPCKSIISSHHCDFHSSSLTYPLHVQVRIRTTLDHQINHHSIYISAPGLHETKPYDFMLAYQIDYLVPTNNPNLKSKSTNFIYPLQHTNCCPFVAQSQRQRSKAWLSCNPARALQPPGEKPKQIPTRRLRIKDLHACILYVSSLCHAGTLDDLSYTLII